MCYSIEQRVKQKCDTAALAEDTVSLACVQTDIFFPFVCNFKEFLMER